MENGSNRLPSNNRYTFHIRKPTVERVELYAAMHDMTVYDVVRAAIEVGLAKMQDDRYEIIIVREKNVKET
jgi:hypothetical protein